MSLLLSGVLAGALSYLVGAVPFGLLIGLMRGVDLRRVGSGNIGASNAWRALGPVFGTVVFLLDVLKGLAGPLIGKSLCDPHRYGDGALIVIALCGILSVVGHTLSIFLGFKGGKGVATGLGVGLGLVPVPALAAFALWGVILGITRYISVASVIALTAAIVFAVLHHEPWPYVGVVVLTTIAVWVKHIPNLKRLREGTEPKVGSKRAAQDGATAPVPPSTGGARP